MITTVTISVYQIGDPSTSFYNILNGIVTVKVREVYGEPLKTRTVLYTGQSFGESALLKNSQRTSMVITKTKVELLVVQREDYYALQVS